MNGLQPVQIQRDLRQIADLIELCFAESMDSSGRATIEDMRMFARFGPALWLLQGLDRMVKGVMRGYVWCDEGLVVGNVSIFPSGKRETWVIANVAVHPDYRGQGIAYRLCQAALERILEWGGQHAILQVDAENSRALHLYYRLGFFAERAFTRWYWKSAQRPPDLPKNMPSLTYRAYGEWRQEYELIRQIRPAEAGGMGWLRPTEEEAFRPSLLKGLFSSLSRTHYVVREGPSLAAVLLTQASFGQPTLQFDMMIHPHYQGELEAPLIAFVQRQASDQFRSAVTEHPADDGEASLVLKAMGFESKRTLIHMRWQLPREGRHQQI